MLERALWGHFGGHFGVIKGSVGPFWGQKGLCGAILGPTSALWGHFGAKKGSVWTFCC